jgi:hypothetical protein
MTSPKPWLQLQLLQLELLRRQQSIKQSTDFVADLLRRLTIIVFERVG